jgi:glycopeptide antibiotics resistance protein
VARGEQDVERLGRRLALGWTLAYAVVIVAVSLWPASLHTDSAHLSAQWASAKASVTFDPRVIRRIHSLRDLATNFLLYVPLGVLVPWSFSRARRSWLWLGALVGLLLSTSLEGAQVLTSRSPSFWDVVMNATGHLAGYLVVVIVVVRRDLSVAVFLGQKGQTPRRTLAAGLRLIYVPLLWLISLLPLNITVRGENLWLKLRGLLPDAGVVYLDPRAPWTSGRITGLVVSALLLVPFGFLGALARPERGRRGYLPAALGALAIGLAIETSQFVVVSRSVDALQIVAAAFGAMCGVLAARLWDRSAVSADDAPLRAFVWRDGLLFALVAYVLLLMVEAWRPFVPVPTSREAYDRLAQANWVPLESYVTGVRSLAIFRDAGKEAGLYVPLGMLLQAFLARVELGAFAPKRFWIALAAALGVGGTLELGQIMFPDRLVDITDVLSHGIGATVGYLILSALRREPAAPPGVAP